MTCLHCTAWRRSLRVRLLAGTLFWVAASILVAGLSLGKLFRNHVAEQFYTGLRTHLDQLTASLVLDGQGQVALAAPLSDPRLSKPYSGLYWQVDRVVGGDRPAAAGVLRSRSLWDSVLAVPADSLADGEIHRHRLPGPAGVTLGLLERRVQIDEAGQGSAWRLIVAADERLMDEPVALFNGALWLALGLLGLGLEIGRAHV